MEIFDKVKAILSELNGAESIEPEHELQKDLGLDSLQMVMLLLLLEENFEMMQKWVEYMHSTGDEEYLWLTGFHYGDWLAMDAGEDSYVGATSNDLIGSAFFAYSTDLLIRAGEVLGKDMSHYRELYKNIVKRFRGHISVNGSSFLGIPFSMKYSRNRLTIFL